LRARRADSAPLARRTGSEIEQTALGVRNARRAAARVAGVALGETPARVARAERKKTKLLKLLDYISGNRWITGGWNRWIGNGFGHR
jgi:hypothetical protein